MNRIQLEQTVGQGGILRLDLPLGKEEAGKHVLITVEPSAPEPPCSESDSWKAAILATAGSWKGDFSIEPLGSLEDREPLP